MASSRSDSSPPSLQEPRTITISNVLRLWLISLAAAINPTLREVTILFDEPTMSISILESFPDESTSQQGVQPASSSSIESLPRVRVSDPDLECSICLSGYHGEGESKVRMMPCGHLFHSYCIERWLGIQRSCPICRFNMPLDEEEHEENVAREGDNDGEGESDGWRIHVVFARLVSSVELNSAWVWHWDSDSEAEDGDEEGDEGYEELSDRHIEANSTGQV